MADRAPVVIIGAARSGTNLLRDIIGQFDSFGTWPCDEINYIWRHGNRDSPTDELQVEAARPDVSRFIRRAFERLARRRHIQSVVEKTCANSLRVPFVDRVLPGARFVFLIRDGRDVAASAMERWAGRLDVRYVARKARYVPPADLPYYAVRYLGYRLSGLPGSAKHLGSWGPRCSGMAEMLGTSSLASICAYQWQRSVKLAYDHLDGLDSSRVHRIRYEELVTSPRYEVQRLAEFCRSKVPSVLPQVSSGRLGRWQYLNSDDQDDILRVAGSTLAGMNYL